MAIQYIDLPVSSGSGGVSSLNGLTGALNIVAGTGITVTPSGTSITIAATGATGANTALSNLAAVAINTSLLPGANGTINLGSPSLNFENLYLDGFTSYTAIATPAAPPAGTKVMYATTEATQTVLAAIAPTGEQVIMFQDLLSPIYNSTGSTITRGQAIYINGEVGGVPSAQLAEANSGQSSNVFGLVLTSSIAAGAIGEALDAGWLTGVNTSGFTAGAELYLSASTPGGLTATAPSPPNFVTIIGTVLVSDPSVGVIQLNIVPAITLPVVVGPVDLYYWATASADIAGYDQLQTTASTSPTVTFTSTGSTSKTLMKAFATPIGSPDTTTIPAGNWVFTIFGTTSANAGSNVIDVDVYQRSYPGGVETLLFSIATPTMSTILTEYDVTYSAPTFTFLSTDRIVFKVSGTSSVAGHTLTFYTQDTTNNSFVQTPLTLATGAVTSISIATANGFAGTSSGGTTPILTISTTLNTPVVAANGTALIAGTTTGTGSTVVLATGATLTSPILVTANLGTPTSLILTNATGTPASIGLANGTGLSLTTGVTGILPVGAGGTGDTTFVANQVILGGTTPTGPLTQVSGGTVGQVLTAVSATAAPTWQTPSSGFTNPMTTEGDMIYEDATPAPNRLPIGTTGQVLTVVAGLPAWAAAGGGSGSGFNYLASNTSVYGGTFSTLVFSGVDNTVVGVGAGTNLTTGTDNSLYGYNAGYALVGGNFNTMLGSQANITSVSDNDNTIIGYQAGFNINGGSDNTIIGYRAVNGATSAAQNVIIGSEVSSTFATGSKNIFIGYDLDSNDELGGTSQSVFIGSTMQLDDNNSSSVVIGYNAFVANGSGQTTVIGSNAISNRAGYDVVIGQGASGFGFGGTTIGQSASTNASNGVAIGSSAFAQGANSVAIGSSAGASSAFSTAVGSHALVEGSTANTLIGSYISDFGNAGVIMIGSYLSANGVGNCFSVGMDTSGSRNNTINANPGNITFGTNKSQGGSVPLTDMFLGASAVGDGTPYNVTIQPTPIFGGGASDTTGGNITLLAGNGVGAGGSGQIIFQVALAGSSGSTADTYATAYAISNTGALLFSGSAGTSGYVLTSTGSGSNPTWQAGGGGGGGVTSVALTVPTFLSVSGSPITTSGTLAVTLSGTALPIANGGTGATTATAAFVNLSPLSTTGDLIYEVTSGAPSRLAIGTTGQVLTVVSGLPAWETPTNTGTVTSVALSTPGVLYTVSGSPVTTAGTLTLTLNTQSANTIFAGPTSGAAATPTFRALVVADMTIATQAISALAIDWSTGYVFTKTLAANSTFTFANTLSGQTIVVRLTNTASNYTVTWPTVKWSGGTAPTMTTGAHSDVYTFVYDGANIYGSYVQNF